jgi:uncharacterized RDD family membrane protein YckC
MSTGYERASQFFDGARPNRRDIVTPEGVPLPVEIANYGERATAFVIDLFIWLCVTLLLLLLLIAALFTTGGNTRLIVASAILFIGFFVRNLYFIYFELSWQGATPGKRIIGLRVIDRRGGPLTAVAVIARNLTREIEAFLPLGILITLGGRGTPLWEQLSLSAWLLFFSALPLFNRDRMRGGDLIAGTMVVSLPRRVLLRDLVEQQARFSFTEPQLRAYGAFELQVLEELLRRPEDAEQTRVLREVRDKICRRIAWTGAVPDHDTAVFLRDFYTAERAYLERAQLFGQVRADKHADDKSPIVRPDSAGRSGATRG